MNKPPRALDSGIPADLEVLLKHAWHVRESEPERAHQLANEARDQARAAKVESAELVATAIVALAAYRVRGDVGILDSYAEIDARLSELGEVGWRMRLMRSVGLVHYARTELGAARQMIDSAMALARECGDDEQAAGALLNIGNIERRLGNSSTALKYSIQAAEVAERVGDRAGLAAALGGAGIVHHELGDYTLALEYFERVLKISEESNFERMIAAAATNIGNVYLRLKEPARARKYYERGAEIRRATGDRFGLSLSIGNIAVADYDLKRYDDALANFEESLELRRSFGDREAMAATMGNIGNVLRRMGRLDEAVAIQKQALEMALELGIPLTIGHVHSYLAETYQVTGQLDLAIHHLKEKYRVEGEWRGAEARKQVNMLESTRQIELARKEAEIERLRNVELAEAHESLQQSHEELASAHAQLESTHRALKHAQSQLVHAEKMASLGQLTAGIAHEINNPVNFIRNSTAPLRRDLDEVRSIVSRALADESDDVRTRVETRMHHMELDELRAEIDALLRGIEEGATRTADIVKGLRTFSRLDESDTKSADLRDGIESTLTLLRPRIADGVTVVTMLDDLPNIECRPGQINQAFMNIISNAIDAVGNAGEVRVTAEHSDAHVQITIADTGCGMTPDQVERIFEPFYTTKDVGQGTGLGLSITHTIIEEHGGTIAVKSTVGTGSSFVVTLPVKSLQ